MSTQGHPGGTGQGRALTVDQQLRLVTWVWSQQPPTEASRGGQAGWLWMGWMDRGADGTKVAWRDRWFARPTDSGEEEDVGSAILEFLADRADRDIYFSPTVYTRRRRIKEAAQPSRIIHADYDSTDPREFAEALKPQVVWETSPGSWQGLHVLRDPLALEEWEHLSRRVTRGLGADRGCWDMPHPIRVPGRRNHKPKHRSVWGDDGAPGVLLRWKRDEAIDWTESPEWLALPDPDEVDAFDPSILNPMTSGERAESGGAMGDSVVDELVARLPAAVRRMLADSREDGDRSDHVHATAKELLKSSLAVDEAGTVLAQRSEAFRAKFGGRRGGLGQQVRRELEAALRALTAEGWRPGTAEEGNAGRLVEPAPDVELLAQLTDWGNAARLVAAHGNRIRYVDQWMSWMVWDDQGLVWRRDTERRVRAMTAQLAKAALKAAESEEDSKRQKALMAHNAGSLNASGVSNCLLQAQAFPSIVVQAEDLDGPHLSETWIDRDGMVIDLRTGAMRLCEPGDLATKRGGISVRDNADVERPEKWLRFLETTFGGGAARLELIQRLVGSSMVGTAKKWFVVLQGPTDSGKSQIQHVLHAVFGDYSGTVKRDTFAYSRWEKANQDGLAALVGTRFAMWSETAEGLRVDEALLKDLTDGVGLPKMVSRKYEKAFPMTPQMTLWMDTNHKPNLRHRDEALWNRVIMLHTLRAVPKSEQVEGLAESIVAEEGGAILRWALEGAKAWLSAGGGKNGLGLSDDDLEKVEEWRSGQDHLGRWLESVIEMGKATKIEEAVSRRDLLAMWVEETGENWSPQRFGKELASRKYAPDKARDDERRWKDEEGKIVRTLAGLRWVDGVR